MALIREFLTEIDAKWNPIGGEPILLQVIGSAALMLQCDYGRGPAATHRFSPSAELASKELQGRSPGYRGRRAQQAQAVQQ